MIKTLIQLFVTSSAPLAIFCLMALVMPRSTFGQSAFVAYSAAGSDAASIAPVVDAFRTALGPDNGNALGSQPSGRREISWDEGGYAANATTFTSPMTAYNTAPLTRGLIFNTPVTGFEISGQPAPKFGDINISYPGTFTTFSPPRLFTPLGSTITDVLFFVPGTNTPATSNAFGAIFTDVDFPQGAYIEYFDIRGNSLGRAYVPPANNGLSFVGFVFDDKRIGRVRIASGNTPVSPTATDGAPVDVVVMDDFIYGEPVAPPASSPPPPPPSPAPNQIGPPTDKDQCKNGGWASLNTPRTFKNQGDCIQFVETGK